MLNRRGWDFVRIAPVTQKPAAPVLSERERREIAARMDSGDFDFDETLRDRLIREWKATPNGVPFPQAMREALDSGDAMAMNRPDLMEISYKLPYSLAYEKSQAEKYRFLIDAVAEKGLKTDGRVVADIGCGFGGLLEQVSLMSKPDRLFGVEVAQSAIDWIRANRPYIAGRVASLDMDTESLLATCGFRADLVFCTEVLEHLMRPALAVANLLALKKENGALALSVPNGRADTSIQHINFWSPESWRSFLAETSPGRRIEPFLLENPQHPGVFDNIAIIT